MGALFDAAFRLADQDTARVLGDPLTLGGVELPQAVYGPAAGGSEMGKYGRQPTALLVINLTLAEVATYFSALNSAYELKGKRGRTGDGLDFLVTKVTTLAGAGWELECGPVGGRGPGGG